jgi:lysyl oxidase-like protein 2/3/4
MPRSKEGFLWTPAQETEGLLTDAVQQGSHSIQDDYDVIIIGAGFTGLIAARDLTQNHGLKALLVDARDRIGGRTWTAKVLGEEVEMGGTWVHWNQPYLYTELHRYGLHHNLKTSAGTSAPETQYFTPARGQLEVVPADKYAATLESVAKRFFSIDGLDSRSLMPYPHDSLRQPSPWQAYDHLSVKDRLDQLHDISQWEKELFESNINTFGSAPGKDIGFVEALRWFALGGHTMVGVFELAGVYKLGYGGMSSFALAIWNEYSGDSLFNTPITEVRQSAAGVEIRTSRGQSIRAKLAISTIPL